MLDDLVITTHDLHFTYPGGVSFNFPDIQLARQGELLITGPSGVGKTTLLHLISGMLRPRTGKVILSGTDIGALGPRAISRFRGQHIGLVFQRPQFIRAITLRENLLLIQRVAGAHVDHVKVNSLLDRLGLKARADALPHRLSAGEQQRSGIAMALVAGPDLILADEPTSSLDDKHAMAVLELLREQARSQEAALLVITHDRRLRERITKHIEL